MKKKTHEQFLEEVFNLVGNEYVAIELYIGANKKMKMKHNVSECGCIWDVTPDKFLRGSRCPNCTHKKIYKKTHEQFLNEVFNLVGDEYVAIERYIGANEKIKIKHNINSCGYVWDVTANSFLQGNRCPECGKKSKTKKLSKTHEQYLRDVFDLIGNEYKVKSKYINKRTKVKMMHNIKKCSHIWSVYPNNFLKGTRCPACNIETRKKSTDSYINEVFSLVKDEYIVLDKYVNAKTKLKMKHNIKNCGYVWEVSPNSFLRGSRCPFCVGFLNNEDFVKLVFELKGKEYTVIGDYKGAKLPIKMRHNNVHCGNYIWDYVPHTTTKVKNIECPICIKKKIREKVSKSKEQFENEVFDKVGGEYSILEDYITCKKHILFQHNKCIDGGKYQWKVNPSHFLKGTRCPKCFGKKLKNTKMYKKEVFELVGDEFVVISEYINAKTKIKIQHNVESCNHIWETIPRSFIGGVRCPKCKESKGERKVREFLERNKINFETQYKFDECKNIRPLPFDFILFNEINNTILLIEYQGIQHYKSFEFFGGEKGFEYRRKNDQIKRDYCKDNNLKLLEIPYFLYDETEKLIEKELLCLNK